MAYIIKFVTTKPETATWFTSSGTSPSVNDNIIIWNRAQPGYLDRISKTKSEHKNISMIIFDSKANGDAWLTARNTQADCAIKAAYNDATGITTIVSTIESAHILKTVSVKPSDKSWSGSSPSLERETNIDNQRSLLINSTGFLFKMRKSSVNSVVKFVVFDSKINADAFKAANAASLSKIAINEYRLANNITVTTTSYQ